MFLFIIKDSLSNKFQENKPLSCPVCVLRYAIQISNDDLRAGRIQASQFPAGSFPRLFA